MKAVILGSTGISSPQNAFGALPIQRDDFDTAIKILRRAYEGGMTFFDTARAYSDSEEKMGLALADVRSKINIATKTMAKTPDEMKAQLETSLKNLKTDYIDIYQFHCVEQCYRPEDGTGMYECMEDFKRQGMIKHIGITNHRLHVAHEAIDSGLYETLQFPFCYISGEQELELVKKCKEKNMGFIAMKGLAGGLINNSKAAMAFMTQYDNVLPIWGIQKEKELDDLAKEIYSRIPDKKLLQDNAEYKAEIFRIVQDELEQLKPGLQKTIENDQARERVEQAQKGVNIDKEKLKKERADFEEEKKQNSAKLTQGIQDGIQALKEPLTNQITNEVFETLSRQFEQTHELYKEFQEFYETDNYHYKRETADGERTVNFEQWTKKQLADALASFYLDDEPTVHKRKREIEREYERNITRVNTH